MTYESRQEGLFKLSRFESAYEELFSIPFQINDDFDVEQYFEISAYYPHAPLNSSVFCVLNLEDYYLDHECKSLVFYMDGLLIKTKEASNAIMNRHFKKFGASYEFMRPLTIALAGENRQCPPYVLGKHQFQPIDGPSKKNVTWINLEQVADIYKIAGTRNYSRIEFKNMHCFDLPIRYQTLKENRELADKIYAFQFREAHEFLKLFTRERRRDVLLPNNMGIEDVMKVGMLSLWKGLTKRCPNRTNRDFQKLNRYIERRFSIKM